MEELGKMAQRPQYAQNSVWYKTPMASNGLYLDTWVPRPIPAKQDDRLWEITVLYEQRPDLLAYDLYGDSNLWWVFQIRNPDDLDDPVGDFKAGKQIYLPQIETIKTALGSL